MGLENFTPEHWYASVFVRLRASLVHAATVNREYEGMLSAGGDEIHISELEPIGVSSYTKNSDISWSNTTSYSKMLKIDQQKYYARNLDSIDRVQANVNLQAAIADEAAYGMMKEADTFIAGKYTEAGNDLGAVTVSAGNVLVNLSDHMYELDNANVPAEGRYFPILPWYHLDLIQAATGIVGHTAVPKTTSDGLLINGYVGNLFGFDLLMTKQVVESSSVMQSMAYHRSAIAFVGQLFEADFNANRESRFGFGMKALYVYGAKVIRPNAMVTGQLTSG